MFKKIQFSILFVLLCVGCDSAAKQQKAEDARRAATVAELKQLGESMHKKQNKESSPADASNDASQGANDSKAHEAVPPSVANSSNAVEGDESSSTPME